MNDNTDDRKRTGIDETAWPKAAPKPGRPVKKPRRPSRLKRFFAVRRNVYITGGVAVLVIAGITAGTLVVVEQNRQQVAAAAAVAAEKEAAADALRAEQLAAEEAEELAELLQTATTRADDATTFHTNSAAWGPADARATLEVVIAALRAAIETGDGPTVEQALQDVYAARDAVGTESDAIDRQYDALVTANGKPGRAGQGRSDCKQVLEGLVYDPADPSKLADYWVSNPYSRIDEAVQFYCPELQPSIDIANKSFTDGSWIAGQQHPAGTYKTVGSVSNCYWARTDGSGNIIDNNFINSALNGVSVTVRAGEQFETSGCGIWRQL